MPTARITEIPWANRPWRGIAAELRSGARYQAAIPGPDPARSRRMGTRRIPTETMYCGSPVVLACVPWADAVDAGRVTCEDARGELVPVEVCRGHVPRIEARLWRSWP